MSHPFYTDDQFAVLMDITERLYSDRPPKHLLSKDKSIDPNKIPKILNDFAEDFLQHGFWGSNNEINQENA